MAKNSSNEQKNDGNVNTTIATSTITKPTLESTIESPLQR